jgi:hypothetical protein
MACYDGDYPVPYDPSVDKHIIERRTSRVASLTESLAKDRAQIKLF